MKKVLALLTLLFILGISFFIYRDKQIKHEAFLNEESIVYLAGENNEVEVLNKDKEVVYLVRGSEVKAKKNNPITQEEKEYYEITYNDETYLVLKDIVKDNIEECVLIDKIYALRDQVVYKEAHSPKILRSVVEGDELEVVSFNQLNSDGSVDYYKVKVGQEEGYIKGKENYVSKEFYKISYDSSRYSDEEDALKIHYYPKVDYYFPNNVMPESCKTLYINAGKLYNIDEYLDIASNSGINAFVVDIKDTDVISYNSPVIHEYSPSSGDGFVSLEFYKEQIQKLKDGGYYTIGRITVFKDPGFALDHKDLTVELDNESYIYNGSMWPSIYQRYVWEYNVSLALEAVKEFGFNEIQFDYVRLPEYIPEEADMKNYYGENSAEAITHFINYAVDVLHEYETYVSIDVFGEVAGNYVTTYGQYWPAISNAADVISPMPYPDHFNRGYYGIRIPWKEPYELITAWANNALNCQNNTYDPAKLRTWIQVYDSIIDKTLYDTDKVRDQIKALEDLGIYDGYITWNGGASFDKYRSVIGAFE